MSLTPLDPLNGAGLNLDVLVECQQDQLSDFSPHVKISDLQLLPPGGCVQLLSVNVWSCSSYSGVAPVTTVVIPGAIRKLSKSNLKQKL